MEQEKREVNSEPIVESETLKPELDSEVDDEEEIVPPQEESEESEEESEEEEVQEEPTSEPSPEEQEEAPVQPKPVEGETPKERALRLEVTRLRREKRETERQSMLVKSKPQAPSEDVYAKLREKYSDDEIKNSEELIDAIAKAKGYVRKEEAYQDSANQVLDTFLDTNSEYKAENDPDDIRWQSFKRILTSDYNLANKTASQLMSIYKKVDRDVKLELGETKDASQDNRKIEAQRQKIQSVSHSGGTKSSTKKSLEVDPSVRSHFKGFEDDDF